MRLIGLVIVCASALILAGCGSLKVASVAGGEARALKAPPCVVKATTRPGQRWVDETTEAGVAALGWQRPRAACSNGVRTRKRISASPFVPAKASTPASGPVAPPPTSAPAPPKKRWWQWRRKKKA